MAIDRGNTVYWDDITFKDRDGEIITVDTATLTVTYPLGNTTEDEDITLTDNLDGTWAGSWQSRVSDTGWVAWTATGVRDSDGAECVKDGKFKLISGKANVRADA